MVRYKHIDTSPRFLAGDLERQLLPGTFEHALNYRIDRQIDLSSFDTRYRNDVTGASAYPPAMMLKVVLLAYSKGIVGSGGIGRACREHVLCITLSGDSVPHFTAFAYFVSTLGDEIAPLFGQAPHLRDCTLIAADTGYHRADNPQQPDPLHDKSKSRRDVTRKHCRPADFNCDAAAGTCICPAGRPAGKTLHQNGANCNHMGYMAVKFQGALRDCQPCTQRDRGLRRPDITQARQGRQRAQPP